MSSLYNSSDYLRDLETALAMTEGIDALAGKSVLITGATGLIGSFLTDMLLYYNQKKHAQIMVHAAGRSMERFQQRFDGFSTEYLKFVPFDLMEPVSFDIPTDFIIHAAGNAFPSAFHTDPSGTVFGNIHGTYQLLEYGRKHGCKRFLFTSTGEVYGELPKDVECFQEADFGYLDFLSPRASYPSSKRAAETLCASYASQYGMEIVIARLCHTFGPNATSSDNRANVQFVERVLEGEDIILKSAGTQMRSYSYIADNASAVLTILLKGTSGEAYNCANKSCRTTIAGLADMIAALSGKKVIYQIPTAEEAAEQSPISHQVLDASKLEELGWSGRYTLKDGLKQTLCILHECRGHS